MWNGKIVLKFAGGAGTSEEPYLISTGAELAFLAQEVNDDNLTYNAENVHFKLTADIVLNDTTDWESWNDTIKPTNIWTPIGNVSKTFLGMFDGTGHTVSGIYLSDNLISQGLFGNVGNDTVKTPIVKNVGVINSYIKSKNYVGGVVGINNGSVTNCYNTGAVSGAQFIGGVVGKNVGSVTDCYNKGSVSGSDQIIGGVVAQNWEGAVLNCYNTGAVSGTTNVGGVVGHNNTDKGIVVNCYSSGNVTGNKKGGVIGLNSGKVANCYFLEAGGLNTVGADTGTVTNCSPFDSSISKQLTTPGQTNRTPENKAWVTFRAYEGLLRTLNNAVENYNVDAAVKVAAWLEGADGNPRHKVMPITPAAGFSGGNGSKETPYLIGTPGELAYLAQQVNTVNDFSKGKFFKLTAHIELNDTAKWKEWGTTTPGKSWTPIGGYNGTIFQGVFDGAGYTVSGIYTEGDVYQALFGIIDSAATVMNVGVIESYIKADGDNIGGIVGCIFSGTVINCYNTGAVSAKGENVGGIAGQNQSGTVLNCYSTGAVSGTTNVGGVVGLNKSAVANCYFLKTNTINKTLEVVGVNSAPGTVTNCLSFDASQDFAAPGDTKPDDTNKALIVVRKEVGLLNALNAAANTYNTKSPAPAVKASAWETIKRNYPTFVTSLPLPEIALSSTSKPYNGAAQEPTVTVGGLNPTTDYTLSWEYAVDGTNFVAGSGTPAFKNAGTYRVTAIGAEGEYKGSKATADYVIAPIGVTLKWTAPTDLVYDKTPKTPEVVVESGLLDGDACAVITKAVTVGGDNTNVGSFTFTATELDNTNYEINTNATSGTYEITKKALKNIKVSKEANGNAEFNAITLISGTSGNNCDGLASGDAVTITFATSKAIIGEYTGDTGFAGEITLGGASANNYSVAKADVNATITGLPIPAFSVMASSAYNKTAHIPTVTIAGLTPTTHYTLKWSYAADNVNFIDVEGTPEFINAGTYLVTATGVAGSDYEGSTQTGDYSINPIVVTLTWQTETTFVYTGSPIVPTVVVGGMIGEEKCEVSIKEPTAADGNINVGTFTMKAKALSNTNYTLPTLAVSGEYTILSAENVWTTPLSIADIYVGGTLAPNAVAKFGTVVYRYMEDVDDGTPSTEAPTAIGNYLVIASVKGTENYNELDAAVKFSIKQRPSDDDSGSGSAIPPEDFFWTGVVSDLKLKTEPVVEVNCKYPRMSRRVLLALQEVDKTLNINLNGEKLAITSKQVKSLTFDKASYSVDELKALIEVKPEITPTPTPTPTEKPTEPTEPTAKKCWLCGACPMFLGLCLWIWLAIAIVAVAVVVVFIVLKKKKKNDKK